LQDSRGFSLIEVLAALFILGVSAATVLGVFSTNLRVIKKSGDHIHATIHARSILDESLAVYDITDARGRDIDLGGVYRGWTEVKSMDREEGGVEMYEVIVTVEWPPSGSVILRGRRAVVQID
jgi:prepilin-type N-terminal cleavage/methylation domain-containing protein